MALLETLSGWFKQDRTANRRASRKPGRRTRRLAVEQLETRELLAANPAIGINLERIVDWSPAWTFTDAFKSSREWVSHSYNTVTGQFIWGDETNNGGAVNVDTHGWPTRLNEWTNAQGQLMRQQLGTLMLDGQNGHYPGGTYRAEWEGSGTLLWGGDARVTQLGVTPAGRYYALLNVTPGNGGIYMRITAMSSANPIHNVHVWMPDYNGQSFAGQNWHPGDNFSPFHPQFVERLRPFKTLRFMDWGVGSTSDLVHWSDRPEVDDARQSTPWEPSYFQDGVAPEYMIELANELDADPWFNMPHMADDDFVRHFAQLARDTLDPGQKVYVEWGNEIWNGAAGFDASRWVQTQMALPANAGLSFYQIWAREARRDFDIWSEVFAGQTNRLVRVAAGFEANSGVTNQVLQNMGGHFDAVACALYTGLQPTQTSRLTSTTTADQIIDILLNESIPRDLSYLRNHQNLANQYSASLGRDIQLVTYEGGPHLDARGAVYQQAYYDAGVSPRMYEVYDRLLTGARDIGLDLFMQFTYTSRPVPSPYGDFGVLHWQDQPTSQAPKYRALLDAISGILYANDPPPPAAPPTVTIVATDASAREAGRDPAVFTITRSGAPLNQPLTVTYTVRGTAVNGTDYAMLSGSVTLSAGAATATITVTPVDDAAAEGRETIVLSMQISTTYAVGAQANATAFLADNDAAALPVLMVIANTDFYYQEYADTRRELEAAGLRVVVAAATRTLARPHANSGQGTGPGTVMPDLAVADARAADYSTVVFVGGWGASMYQYAFTGSYTNTAYNGSPALKQAVNRLVTDFVLQDKYITAICHGVSVLAWARVNGVSPLAAHRVSAYAGGAPPSNIAGGISTRWHVEQNGATMVASRSLGDAATATDDVLVDGKIITAENWDSARQYGRTIADYLRN